MSQTVVLDRDYLDCRCMLLELAAILDRHDRAKRDHNGAKTLDQRLLRIGQAMEVLTHPSPRPDRVERILNLLSDPLK